MLASLMKSLAALFIASNLSRLTPACVTRIA